MNETEIVLNQDFSNVAWDEIKAILEDEKTKIEYANDNKKYDLAYSFKKSSLVWLFLICILGIILPFVEYFIFDNSYFFILIAVDLVFIAISGKVTTPKWFWVIFALGLFNYNDRIILWAGVNLFIIWILLNIWTKYIDRTIVRGITANKDAFVSAWMGYLDRIEATSRSFHHTIPAKKLEEKVKAETAHAEQLEKDKIQLVYYNREFEKRFGMYLNPITEKPISGAQDYLEALLTQRTSAIQKFEGELTIAELDQKFSDIFSSMNVSGMKDYLESYDRQQAQVAYQEHEEEREDEDSIESEDDDVEESKGKDYYLKQLDSMVGMETLKRDVRELIDFVQMQKYREANGLKSLPLSLHLVFSGNPGTGKTSVARILANIYREIGVLSKGQLVEVDRADLVAGYVGQTAIKTKEKIEEAMGGVLFIDEAYTLNKEGNDFGQEAIDTILKAMEDNRDKFIVIVAGYPGLMKDFINSNPGLKSRFSKTIIFPDYNSEELFEIFIKFCNDYDYILSNDAYSLVKKEITEMVKNRDYYFANAREVRNFFEKIVANQAARVMNTEGLSDSEMITIEFADIKR
jgi:SpoVK/Ycf46/Vps4 family AAA+-type ATPase